MVYTQGGMGATYLRVVYTRVVQRDTYLRVVYTRVYISLYAPYHTQGCTYLPICFPTTPPRVHHPVYSATRLPPVPVSVYSDEALGSTLGYTLGERLSGASLLSVVLRLVCPSAQSCSVSQGIPG